MKEGRKEGEREEGREGRKEGRKAECKQDRHKTWPSCFSARLRGQEMLLATNFKGRSTFYRK